MIDFNPNQGQTCTITDSVQAKGAAILFDRVFVLGSTDLNPFCSPEFFEDQTGMPAEIGFIPDLSSIASENPALGLLVAAGNIKFQHGEGADSSMSEMNLMMNNTIINHYGGAELRSCQPTAPRQCLIRILAKAIPQLTMR